MTNSIDPRVEAAARAIEDAMLRQGKSPDAHDLARAALLAADAAAWQPIESAPKDGTVINVLLPHDISDSDREFYCYPQSRVSFGWAWGNGKFRPCAGISVPVFIEPTHWMPLPMTPEPKP